MISLPVFGLTWQIPGMFRRFAAACNEASFIDACNAAMMVNARPGCGDTNQVSVSLTRRIEMHPGACTSNKMMNFRVPPRAHILAEFRSVFQRHTARLALQRRYGRSGRPMSL
jgi:hypothetical protein